MQPGAVPRLDSRRRVHQLVDAARSMVRYKEVAGFVVAERRHAYSGFDWRRFLPRLAVESQDPCPAIAVVAVDVEALHAREARPAIDVASGHRTAFFMAVLGDGQRETVARAVPHIAMVTFHSIPAVVFPARARSRLIVDLLPGVLPDVADIEVAGIAVE